MAWLVLLVVVAVIAYSLLRGPSAPIAAPESKPPSLAHLPEHFVVFDLETTGLDSGKHEIIEIGAIRVNRDSTKHEGFQFLVKPTKKIPGRITELTGITQAMVDSEGQPLDKVMRDFNEFIGDLRLVSYNAQFDMAFLNAAALAHGISFKNPVSCALKMARRAWPGRTSYRLADISRDGKLSTDNPHRALADCERALMVYAVASSRLGSLT
jgi:DNA polymerase III subunit epsilon